MTEHEGPTGLIDETKHSTTVRAQNGATLTLTRGEPLQGVHFLTIKPRDGRQGAELVALLSDDDIRALLVPRAQCCASCAHARKSDLGSTRCHQRAHSRGGQHYFPRIAEPSKEVCGKFEQLVKPAARQVAA